MRETLSTPACHTPLDRVHNALTCLDNIINELEEKAQPILRPANTACAPANCQSAPKDPQVPSPHVAQIADIEMKIDNAVSRIRVLRSRMDF